MENISKNSISLAPKEVLFVLDKLTQANFEAFLVGGCVRDVILGRVPKDWDITTNANPEQVVGLFEKTVYENKFGTVAVMVPRETLGKPTEGDIDDVSYETVEVTPYRLEGKYTDFRHPDEVRFSQSLKDDLKRRDFTVNAMAMSKTGEITDIFLGLSDIKSKVLRTVGEPKDRFTEDALRMLRAVRFACELDFVISYETMNAIVENSFLIKNISAERVRDEFEKIILSARPSVGVDMLQKFGLLKYIIPELEEGIHCEQGGAHRYDVYEHLLQALQHTANKNLPLELRLSALFHDIGKPRTRREASPVNNFPTPRTSMGVSKPDRDRSFSGSVSKRPYTFYGHEVVGARMARKIMERLKFPKKETDLVESMVRNHMFFSDTEQITLSAVRRIIAKVTPEHIWNLMDVREADRVGMAKKEAPYRLRKYHAMIDEALRDPISVKQLKIDGNFLMKEMQIPPGPKMGSILNALLEEVLDDPSKNDVEYFRKRVGELQNLSDSELDALGKKAKEKKEELEDIEVGKLHQKHGVKK